MKWRWETRSRAFGSLGLQRSVEGSAWLAKGAMVDNAFGLYLQQSGRPIQVNGEWLGPNTVFVLPPKAEFCFCGRGSVEWFSVVIPTTMVESDLESVVYSAGAVRRSPRIVTHLIDALESAFSSPVDAPNLAQGIA